MSIEAATATNAEMPAAEPRVLLSTLHDVKVWIRTARTRADLPRPALARQLAIPRPLLADWESTQSLDAPALHQFALIAEACGAPVPVLARALQLQLGPVCLAELTDEAAEERSNPEPCVLASPEALKAWLLAQRERCGLPRMTAGRHIGRDGDSIRAMEDPASALLPTRSQLELLALAYDVAVPDLGFALKGAQPCGTDLAGATVREEMLQEIERGARELFGEPRWPRAARYLDAIFVSGRSMREAIEDHGGRYVTQTKFVTGLTKHLASTVTQREAFDRLLAAARTVTVEPLASLEARLADVLGGATIEGAMAYGRLVLGSDLQLVIEDVEDIGRLVSREGVEGLLHRGSGGWIHHSIVTGRRLINQNGAALFPVVVEAARSRSGDALSSDTVLELLQSLPRFEWLDQQGNWFWFGPEDANRVHHTACAILAHAGQPVDVETLHAGLARRFRNASNRGRGNAVVPPNDLLTRVLCGFPDIERRANLLVLTGDHTRWIERETTPLTRKVLVALRDCGNVASTAALREKTNLDAPNLVRLLRASPLVAAMDRGVYAIRGAAQRAGALDCARDEPRRKPGCLRVTRENGWVCWQAPCKRWGRRWRTHVPAQAADLPGGAYRLPDGRTITICGTGRGRYVERGLSRMAKGLGEGALLHFRFNPHTLSAAIDRVESNQQDVDDHPRAA